MDGVSLMPCLHGQCNSALVALAAPGLLAINGVGVEVAGALLVTVGDNPERLCSEASFARPWLRWLPSRGSDDPRDDLPSQNENLSRGE
jgi:hypothetical protein